VDLGRLGNGERISGISAILLFVLMFLHWFSVEAINTSNLLFAIQSVEPGKSAWEALNYIPIVLVITIVATLTLAGLRLTNAVQRPSILTNAVVAILGIVSVLLILFRIVDPPVFSVEATVTLEGAAQFPIFLALVAAAGIAFGGCLAMREEGTSLSGLRTRQRRDQRPAESR
jgi:purine-cytosine permease-like protein